MQNRLGDLIQLFSKKSFYHQGCFFMFLFLIPPTIRQQFNTCLACFNDLLVIMLRFGVGIIALCCYLYAFGICCVGIISDPLRGSTQGWGIVTKLRSQASLHGVNHNMPFPTALKPLFSTFLVLSPSACFQCGDWLAVETCRRHVPTACW